MLSIQVRFFSRVSFNLKKVRLNSQSPVSAETQPRPPKNSHPKPLSKNPLLQKNFDQQIGFPDTPLTLSKDSQLPKEIQREKGVSIKILNLGADKEITSFLRNSGKRKIYLRPIHYVLLLQKIANNHKSQKIIYGDIRNIETLWKKETTQKLFEELSGQFHNMNPDTICNMIQILALSRCKTPATKQLLQEILFEFGKEDTLNMFDRLHKARLLVSLSLLSKKIHELFAVIPKIAHDLLKLLKHDLKKFNTLTLARIASAVVRFEIRNLKIIELLLSHLRKRSKYIKKKYLGSVARLALMHKEFSRTNNQLIKAIGWISGVPEIQTLPFLHISNILRDFPLIEDPTLNEEESQALWRFKDILLRVGLHHLQNFVKTTAYVLNQSKKISPSTINKNKRDQGNEFDSKKKKKIQGFEEFIESSAAGNPLIQRELFQLLKLREGLHKFNYQSLIKTSPLFITSKDQCQELINCLQENKYSLVRFTSHHALESLEPLLNFDAFESNEEELKNLFNRLSYTFVQKSFMLKDKRKHLGLYSRFLDYVLSKGISFKMERNALELYIALVNRFLLADQSIIRQEEFTFLRLKIKHLKKATALPVSPNEDKIITIDHLKEKVPKKLDASSNELTVSSYANYRAIIKKYKGKSEKNLEQEESSMEREIENLEYNRFYLKANSLCTFHLIGVVTLMEKYGHLKVGSLILKSYDDSLMENFKEALLTYEDLDILILVRKILEIRKINFGFFAKISSRLDQRQGEIENYVIQRFSSVKSLLKGTKDTDGFLCAIGDCIDQENKKIYRISRPPLWQLETFILRHLGLTWEEISQGKAMKMTKEKEKIPEKNTVKENIETQSL